MQRTPHRCPECSQMLALSSDMWGFYYLCAHCGWTGEDDDQVIAIRRQPASIPHAFLTPPPPPPPSQRRAS
jgi:hypothetical protein